MLGHLRNVALLLCMQRSSRHKNCRIGGLMFDSIYLKFNSKQSSTWDLAKEILHLFKHLSSEKGFYYQTSLYYITLLAKFGNCCSMVWVHRQGQWMGKYFSLSFLEEAAKKLRVVLQCIFGRDFLSQRPTIALGVENYSSPSMSCCSDDLAQLLPCLDH